MAQTYKRNGDALTGIAHEGTWPGIASRFHLIIVAGLRTKQLLHGSKPRIEVIKGRRRNTTIALEEVKRGLVPFQDFYEQKRIAAEIAQNRKNGGTAVLKDAKAAKPGSLVVA